MSIALEEKRRNVIPRWRDFSETLELKELGSSLVQPSEIISASTVRQDLSEQFVSWSANRSISYAGDLLSAALVCQQPEAALDAAEYVLSLGLDESRSITKLARKVLDRPHELSTLEFKLTDDQSAKDHRWRQVSKLRKSLRTNQRDAISWIDLARLYTILGSTSKAERAIRVACNLAPTNRFVVRSAARFYAHIGDLDFGHKIILNSERFLHDPWLASAEIALSTLAKKWSRATNEGLKMVSNENFSALDLTELATAIATLDFANGNARKARKLIKRALVHPNDNSLAQAKWISRSMSGLSIDVPVAHFAIPRPFEAAAYEAFTSARWNESLGSALQWFRDEPFASRPAYLAGYIAGAILDDHELAIKIADAGLVSNPDDVALINNRVFNFASLNRLQEARKEILRLKVSQLDSTQQVVYFANQGLIAFRESKLEEGRAWYTKATNLAAVIGNKRYHVSALIHWAKEEALHGTSFSRLIRERAKDEVESEKDPDFKFMMKRLESEEFIS